MVETSTFRGVLNFFVELGIYDVILPFLLVFGIMFAILDKTKVLGTETVGKDVYPKKNLNAIVAFAVGFFVVASAQLVEVITKVSSQAVILLLLIVLFLVMAGSFMDLETLSTKGVHLKGGWNTIFMLISFIGIAFIFLNALDWLDPAYEFLRDHWNNELVSSVILLGTIILIMLFITGGFGKKNDKEEEKKGI